MKILLADPPQKEEYYNLIFPSLGILYLIAYSKKKFFNEALDFYYLEGHCNLKEHLRQVRQYNPDIYGISITTPVASLAYKTIDAVKKENPHLPVVCGGAHPTAAPEDVFQKCKADICVLGEGEETFSELIAYYGKFGNKLKLEEISGIAFRRNGKIYRTEKRSLIKNLDSIPFPAWDLIDFNKYPGTQYKKKSPQTYILVSRGCPFNCVFCSNPVWKLNKPWVRMRSPGNIIEEIRYLYEKGIREIRLACDEFNVRLDWAIEVCKQIENCGLRDLYFSCNIRADNVTEELAEWFKKANIWCVYMGIESGNQRTLDGIGKKITLKNVINACQILKKAKIKVCGYFMFYNVWEEDGHLCWETVEDVNNTLKFALRLYKDKLVDYISWQITTPFPGSRLWDIARRHNLIDLATMDYKNVFRQELFTLPGISRKDMRVSLAKGFLLKSLYALRSGNVDWGQTRRIWDNVKAIIGIFT